MIFNISAENINYVKITYKDKNDFTHCIKAAVKFMSDYELLACAKNEEDLKIAFPQDVELGIACENGLYKTHTTLKNITYEPPYVLFSLSRPEETEYQQNREYFRVKLNEDANIIYKEDENEVTVAAITYDLSANGVRIELDKEMTFPENVRLMLFLPQRTIDVQAQYVRNDNEDQIIKASFRFADIPQSDLDYISQICLQKQLEERRKNLM